MTNRLSAYRDPSPHTLCWSNVRMAPYRHFVVVITWIGSRTTDSVKEILHFVHLNLQKTERIYSLERRWIVLVSQPSLRLFSTWLRWEFPNFAPISGVGWRKPISIEFETIVGKNPFNIGHDKLRSFHIVIIPSSRPARMPQFTRSTSINVRGM